MRWDRVIASTLFIALACVPNARADWPPGGKRVSSLATAPNGNRLQGVVADGAGGGTIIWVYGQSFSSFYELYAQHLTVLGELPPGWSPSGLDLGFSEGLTYGHRRLQPAITDAAAGAILPFLQYESFGGPSTDFSFRLGHVLSDGTSGGFVFSSPAWPPQVYEAAVAPDGSGGVVGITQHSYESEFDPNRPITLCVQRRTAGGSFLWPELPDSPGPVIVPGGQVQADQGLAATSDGSGGGFFAWVDVRAGDPDLYVQHVLADGSMDPAWPAGGVGVCTAVGSVMHPSLVYAGGGRVFVTWEDSRNPQSQLFAACLEASGALAPGCPVNGRPLGGPSVITACLGLLSDGAGGAFVLRGERFFTPALHAATYCHRIQVDGLPSPGWPSGGKPLNAGVTPEPAAGICSDGAGGVFVEFWDGAGPSSPAGVYAMHLAADGTDAPGWTGAFLLSATGGPPVGVDGSAATAIACWTDSRDPGGSTVYAQRLESDGVVAIEVSLASAVARPDNALLRWHVADQTGLLVTIERRSQASDWIALGTSFADGAGFVEYDDRSVTAGTHYGYRLAYLEGGAPRTAGEVWLEIPAGVTFGIDPHQPTLIEGAVALAINLDLDEPAHLQLMDVTGRCVATCALPNHAGRQVVDLARAGSLPAGLYFARLTQHGRIDTRRLIVSQ